MPRPPRSKDVPSACPFLVRSLLIQFLGRLHDVLFDVRPRMDPLASFHWVARIFFLSAVSCPSWKTNLMASVDALL